MSIVFRLRGTVILKIWWQIVLVTSYTAATLCLLKFALGWELPDLQKKPKPGNPIRENTVGIFGLFTGFLLVFRANTAYERYWEARKHWSSITFNIRTLSRLIWTMVSLPLEGRDSSRVAINKVFLEKVSAIKLLVAFAYATRNYLREVHSYEEKDVAKLLQHVPKPFKTRIGPVPEDPRGRCNTDLEGFPRNIPVEISHLIMSYITKAFQQNLVDEATLKTMNNALNNLVENLGQCEKILKTPIPNAYSIHAHHTTWIYFLALPYQLIDLLDWFTIPVVTLAAFCMLGVLHIGREIENPFGYDDNDLPLDQFCKVIDLETQVILGNPLPPVQSWALSPLNCPLMPESCLTAPQLQKLTEEEIREILGRFRRPVNPFPRRVIQVAMATLFYAGLQKWLPLAAGGDAIIHVALVLYGSVCGIEAIVLDPFDPQDHHDGHEGGVGQGKRAEEVAFFLFAVILSLCRVLLAVYLLKAVKQDDYIRCKTWLVFTFLLLLVTVFNDAFHFSVSVLPTVWYMSAQLFGMVYTVAEVYLVVQFMKTIDNNNDRIPNEGHRAGGARVQGAMPSNTGIF